MKKAKRIIATLLLLVLVFTIAACAKETPAAPPATTPTPAAPPAGGGDNPPAPPPASGVAGGREDYTAQSYFGLYNPDYDYSGGDPYKIAFISLGWGNMNQRMSDNFSAWAKTMNVDYQSVSCDSDVEKMISYIESYSAQGYSGLLINSHSAIMDRIQDLCEELEMPWWCVAELKRTSDGVLHGPYSVTNSEQWGYDVVKEEAAWMAENVADFKDSETMVVVLSITMIEEFVQRNTGCERAAKEFLPNALFEIGDGLAEGGVSPEIAYNMCATRVTAHPEIKNWIFAVCQDDFTLGVVNFCNEYKLNDRAIISSCGGDDLVPLFETGEYGAWRFALHSDLSLRFNAVFNGMYALLAGWAQPEDFWKDGIHAGDDAYYGINIAYIKMTPDNYKDYLEFCDWFTGLNNYSWEWSGKHYPVIFGDKNADA
jgi:ABC-type sugar transport system substrate-binding protein